MERTTGVLETPKFHKSVIRPYQEKSLSNLLKDLGQLEHSNGADDRNTIAGGMAP